MLNTKMMHGQKIRKLRTEAEQFTALQGNKKKVTKFIPSTLYFY